MNHYSKLIAGEVLAAGILAFIGPNGQYTVNTVFGIVNLGLFIMAVGLIGYYLSFVLKSVNPFLIHVVISSGIIFTIFSFILVNLSGIGI